MNRIEKAKQLRKQIQSNLNVTRRLIRVDELTEEELNEMIDLYDAFEIGRAYITNEILNFENKLYRVVQDHTSQEDWRPDELPALYTNLVPENVIPEWIQPLGGHDAWPINQLVIYEGDIWINTVADNVWTPGEYGWELYDE